MMNEIQRQQFRIVELKEENARLLERAAMAEKRVVEYLEQASARSKKLRPLYEREDELKRELRVLVEQLKRCDANFHLYGSGVNLGGAGYDVLARAAKAGLKAEHKANVVAGIEQPNGRGAARP